MILLLDEEDEDTKKYAFMKHAMCFGRKTTQRAT